MGQRRYQLLCPVARSLDVLGDRWTLLILRDLHAGPARFQELQTGLGMATNLLATRLGELVESGVVERLGTDRHAAYALTDLGRATDRLLWELVRFGARVDRDPDLAEPGNHRTIALPLRMMLEAVDERPDLRVRLHVDGDAFDIATSAEAVLVVSASPGSPGDDADLVLDVDYEPFVDLAEGRISVDRFARDHRRVVRGEPSALAAFGAMITEALTRDFVVVYVGI